MGTIQKTKVDPITGLTHREEMFCYYYVHNMSNGRSAYKQLSPKVKDSTADCEASKLLRNPKVFARIEALKEEMKKTAHISLEQLIESSKRVYDEAMKPQETFDLKGRPTGRFHATDLKAADSSIKTIMSLEHLDAPQVDTTALDTLAQVLMVNKQLAKEQYHPEEEKTEDKPKDDS